MKAHHLGIGAVALWSRMGKGFRGVILAVFIIAGGAGLWLCLHREAPLVTVSGANAYIGVGMNNIRSGNVKFDLRVRNTAGEALHYADLVIDQWTDDKGTSFFIEKVSPGAGYLLYGSSNGVLPPFYREGPASLNSAHSELFWRIVSPNTAASDATAMSVAGHVRLVEATDVKTETIKDVKLAVGERFLLGRDEWVVSRVEALKDGRRRVLLDTAGLNSFPKRIQVVDEQGDRLQVSWIDAWGGAKMACRAAQPFIRHVSFDAPVACERVSLFVDYRAGGGVKKVPFRATIPLTHNPRPRFDTIMEMRLAHFMRTPPGLVSDCVALPHGAWGAPGVQDPAALFTLTSLSSRVLWGADEFMTRFLLKSSASDTIASYNVVLTGCTDSEGNHLFSLGGPVHLAAHQYWIIESKDFLGARGRFYEPGAVLIRTNVLPSLGAESVTFEGRLTVKLGRKPKQFVARDVPLDGCVPVTLGPLELRFIRKCGDSINVLTRGDAGLLRSVTVEKSDGTSLGTTRRTAPHLYWSDAEMGSLHFSEFDYAGPVTYRAVIFDETEHYTFPFKVTVPLDASGE